MFGRVHAGFQQGWRLAAHSLSGRLLLLTIFYVMLGEVLIFVPSIGQYYRELLGNHIESAELAILPFTMKGGESLPEDFRARILTRARAAAVLLKRADQRQLFLVDRLPQKVDVTIDLRSAGFGTAMLAALDCLLHSRDRMLHVISATKIEGAQSVSIILGEAPIREALRAFAERVVVTGLVVSAVAAALVFASLFFGFVRPLERITAAMLRFRANPEDSSRIITPSARRDEIGVAESELAAMQREIYGSLQQKNRLAALGGAVARIQHDLRNILANAQLASERLSAVDDPVVKRLTPRLVASLDRAIGLATATLRYGRAEERAPARRRVALKPIVAEACETVLEAPGAISIVLTNHVDSSLLMDADPEHLFRILLNLLRNAAEALCQRADARIAITAERSGKIVSLEIADNGPGLPSAMQARVFQPFSSSAGGTGLGLAIARELARLHGGEVTLVSTGPTGTVFRIDIPDRDEV